MQRRGPERVAFAEPQAAELASHSRVAFASMASKTGSSSPGELEDDLQHLARSRSAAPATRRARACAACTSSNSRTFSIAITAWSAKVLTSSICLSVNGRTSERVNMITPIGVPSRRSGTPSTVRYPPVLLCSDHGDILDRLAHRRHEQLCRREPLARAPILGSA